MKLLAVILPALLVTATAFNVNKIKIQRFDLGADVVASWYDLQSRVGPDVWAATAKPQLPPDKQPSRLQAAREHRQSLYFLKRKKKSDLYKMQ